MIRYFLIILICLIAGDVCGQRPSYWNFSGEHGIAGNSIYRILQARDGHLWLGTENGLYRFDGIHFRKYGPKEGLPGSEIIHLAIDSLDRIWVGTFSGKIAYLANGDVWDRANAPWIPELNGVPTTLATLSNGEMLVGTRNSAWIFSPTATTKILTEEGFHDYQIALDNEDGSVSLLRYPGSSRLIYPTNSPDSSQKTPGTKSWRYFFFQNQSAIATASRFAHIEAEHDFVNFAHQ
ncbi:MAG: two-component regulator propeller domain-containing protein, partial [Bacteroidota bacterium]